MAMNGMQQLNTPMNMNVQPGQQVPGMQQPFKRKPGFLNMFEKPWEEGGIFSYGLGGKGKFNPTGGEFVNGKPSSFQQLPTKTPQQISYLDNLLSSSQKNLNNPYQGFEPIEQQARQDFATKTLPGLAARFTKAGYSHRGSAFNSGLGAGAADLDKGLAALRSQYGMANRQQSLAEGRLGLSPQFQIYHEQAKKGLLDPEVAQSLLVQLLPLLVGI